jgi:hypothetical protein
MKHVNPFITFYIIGVRERKKKKERKYIYWTAHTSKTDTGVTKKKTEVNTHK